MKHTVKTLAAVLFALSANAAIAGDIVFAPVETHPSQGDVRDVAGARTMMAIEEEGLFVNLETSGLTPGNVHTLWLVVINNPGACEEADCGPKDVLKRSEIVRSDVAFAGGLLVGDDGTAKFDWFQSEGEMAGGWFGHGLEEAASAEVHLVVNDHGPLIEGRAFDMLTTYRGGCTEASIPAPMPQAARDQGIPGPNQCRLMQHSIFKAARPES